MCINLKVFMEIILITRFFFLRAIKLWDLILHARIRYHDFLRNTALQCWNNAPTIWNNVATMLQRCVTLQIVVARSTSKLCVYNTSVRLQNPMFQSPVNCFFPDVLSNQNMVRVIKGKIIWKRGIKKLHVRLVSERFELSIEGSIPCYRE